jgi:signal transduction histidine kinase
MHTARQPNAANSPTPRPTSPRRLGRLASAGLAIVLIFLTGFALWVAFATNRAATFAKHASDLSDKYEQARYAIGAEESLERKYRLEPGPEVREKHQQAAATLIAALQAVHAIGDPSDQALVDTMLADHDRYLDALNRMFAAVDIQDTARVNAIDEQEVDPLFAHVEQQVDTAADAHHAQAIQSLSDLSQTENLVFITTPIVFTLGLLLLGVFWRVLRTYQHNIDAAIKREAEQEVERIRSADRAKSAFLANMSHELRTPLNAIIGHSEMLQEDTEALGLTEMLADVRIIWSSGQHLLALVDGILDLTKIEVGKMQLYLETFALPTLINDAVLTMRLMIEQNGNVLELHGIENLGTLHADMTKVRQILLNLLSNATKFTQNGTITLSGAHEQCADGTWIVLRIADTGVGMTAEQVQRLFQPFTQAHAGTARKYGGNGLGLALSRHLCQLMGGDISVESAPGQGSTFTIRFPAVVTTTDAATERPTAAVSSGISSYTPAPSVWIDSIDPILSSDADELTVLVPAGGTEQTDSMAPAGPPRT